MLTMAEIPVPDRVAARDAVETFARVEQGHEDELIDALCGTALLLCEAFCGRIGLAREAVETLPASAEWRRLGAQPVRAITQIEGLPADGGAFGLPVDAYEIDIDADGAGWVRVTQPGAAGQVR